MCLSNDVLTFEGIEEEGESWSMKTNKTGKCKRKIRRDFEVADVKKKS